VNVVSKGKKCLIRVINNAISLNKFQQVPHCEKRRKEMLKVDRCCKWWPLCFAEWKRSSAKSSTSRYNRQSR